ncbi:MAG: TonB-dependent receptor [Bacteroidetes bacterium]|nr:TonB-dependent receptor [Bacteroidota bacterium]
MLKKIAFVVLTLFFTDGDVFSQERHDNKTGGVISGKIFDESAKAPIEYANIILFNSKDSTQVTGTVTDKEGKFILTNIPSGKYFINVQFIGYERRRIRNISITTSKLSAEIGNIFIKPSAINLERVDVKGTRSPVTYQIDKKVIDVSQMQTSISGNVADVLENVPSVNVDVDGNVSLRGSTNFTVLIDNRPSVMDPQDALQQIPASAIETIEIITNPSAKYDAEGNAGIINIKMKSNSDLGLSGITNLNAGVNDKYGGDFLFEYRTSSVNYNFGMDYNRRFSPGTSKENRQFDTGNNSSFINSNGDSERGRISFGIRGGLDFNLSKNDKLNIGGRFGKRSGEHNSVLNYVQWSTLDPQNIFYLSRENSNRSGWYYAVNTNYTHKFSLKDHEISGEFFASHRNSDESSSSSEINNNIQFDGKKTTEAGPSTEFRGKIDYTLPLGKTNRFEAGSQGEIELSDESNGLYNFNPANGNYEFQSLFSQNTKSNVSQLSLYSIYADEIGNLGIQGGIRSEYTFRTIELLGNNQNFSLDQWDIFPSFHTSYKFGIGSQLMVSYTRRIDRPHNWFLEPFYTWEDANNIRKGNPSLKPELIDSYEFGFQTMLGQVSVSNDFYYRVNHNVIDEVQSVYSENVTLNSFENVGTDYSLGSEFMIVSDPFNFWNVNLMGNIYDYKIDGVINNEAFSRTNFNWSARFNNSFKITESLQAQLNFRYHSQEVAAQERESAMFSADLSVKKEFIEKKLSLTLQIRDIFRTRRHESTSTGVGFYSYNYHSNEAPMILLNLRFNFNNYKNEEEKQNGDEMESDNGGEDS